MARLFHHFGRLYRRHAPDREQLSRSPWLKPFGQRIWQSDLWRFTRRSVPRGVAVGLFIGIFLMVPGLQAIGAILLAAPIRANIPIGVAMTFMSNPATTPFFLIAAINVGNLLGFEADLAAFHRLYASGADAGDWLRWLLSDAAPAMVSGLAVIGVGFAFAGYWVSLVAWRLWIGSKWRSRVHRTGGRANEAAPL